MKTNSRTLPLLALICCPVLFSAQAQLSPSGGGETTPYAVVERGLEGGMGYGEAKNALLEKVETYFAPAREKRSERIE